MQIICNQKSIDFEKTKELYPSECEILKDCQNLDWKFVIDDGHWKFEQPPFNPIGINIDSVMQSHKETFFKSSPYSEQMAKAIGLKAGRVKPSVLDATGGLLGDTLLMLSLGLPKIHVFERHPLAAVLIVSALKRSSANIEFEFKSALSLDSDFDVIFFDPMYMDKNVKSAAKKEMVLFRQWIGNDEDALVVALHLKSRTQSRLVIKRSIKAAPLIEKPSLQFKGKSTRYDVYLSL